MRGNWCFEKCDWLPVNPFNALYSQTLQAPTPHTMVKKTFKTILWGWLLKG